MKKKAINLFVLGGVVLTLALFGCNSGKTADTTAAGALIDGASLYNKDCSGCHGSLATSGKKGATVAQIQDAISHNWGGMGVFASLTADQIQAIAAALPAQVTTNPDTTAATTLDGAALYTANCSSCHGALAASGKSGTLASAIQAAITSNSGGMGRFSNLTTAQVQAIADALATVPASTPAPGGSSQTLDGAALYAKYCQGCHNPLASSRKIGASVSRIQAGISSEPGMKSLSTLSQAQLDAIASALGAPASGSPSSSGGTSTSGGSTTSTDGAALYTQHCENCHDPLVASMKAGRTALQIQTAISNNKGGMGYLSTLTIAQIDAIASALAAAPTPAPTDGAALYTNNCSSCHNPLASSTVIGASASAISSAIASFSQMSSISLTSTQIEAIATALGTTVGGSTTCTSFTYSAWGACQSDSTQTRTVATSSPAGCTGGTPVLSQACTYVPPVNACTSFTYSAWGTCQSNNTQTRTVATSSPAGCTGGTPVLSQACTYVPPVADGTALYNSNCSGCHNALASSSKKGRTATQIQNAINSNTGGMGSTSLRALTTAQVAAIAGVLATTPPAACTSFTYSAWGTCQSNNTQTRTVATSSPAGCTGGTPVLSQACTYVPPVNACTSFTYSAWGTCQSNNTQTRTVATSSPAGCTGGTPVLSQACTYVPPVADGTALYNSNCSGCHNALASSSKKGRTATQIQNAINSNTGGMGSTSLRALTTAQVAAIAGVLATTPPAACTSFTYSAWGTCQSNNTQTRTVATSSPAGCTGGTPVLSQACTYVPPVNACTSFTYSAWGTCQSNNTQTRTVATSSPAGCTGGTPVLSQACTYVPPTQTCGSCHAIPPTTGHHTYHYPSKATCSTCHGTGYSPTAVTAATHQNGVKDVVSSLNFNATTRSCSPGCHGTKSW